MFDGILYSLKHLASDNDKNINAGFVTPNNESPAYWCIKQFAFLDNSAELVLQRTIKWSFTKAASVDCRIPSPWTKFLPDSGLRRHVCIGTAMGFITATPKPWSTCEKKRNSDKNGTFRVDSMAHSAMSVPTAICNTVAIRGKPSKIAKIRIRRKAKNCTFAYKLGARTFRPRAHGTHQHAGTHTLHRTNACVWVFSILNPSEAVHVPCGWESFRVHKSWQWTNCMQNRMSAICEAWTGKLHEFCKLCCFSRSGGTLPHDLRPPKLWYSMQHYHRVVSSIGQIWRG